MTEEDERPDAAKLAGRALRALRAQQPEQAEQAEPAEASAPAEPTGETEPVSLAKSDKPRQTLLPAPEADDSDAKADTRARNGKRKDEPSGTNSLLVVAGVLVVLALAFAVIGFVVHQRGTDSADAKRAAGRDDALTAARIDIATLQTLDYKDVKAGLAKWLAVTTGGFHDDIAKAVKTTSSAIASAKRVTVGKVLSAAVTELDLDKGVATVIASVEVTRTPEGGTSTVDRNRYRATLQRVGDAWKITNLGQVAVALS